LEVNTSKQCSQVGGGLRQRQGNHEKVKGGFKPALGNDIQGMSGKSLPVQGRICSNQKKEGEPNTARMVKTGPHLCKSGDIAHRYIKGNHGWGEEGK